MDLEFNNDDTVDYKQLYEDLLNQYQQQGGAWYDKFILSKNDNNYQTIINKLQDFCKDDAHAVEQLKEKLDYLKKNVDSKLLAKYDIANVLEYLKNSKVIQNIDWKAYHAKICKVISEKIIPELTKERKLQSELVTKLKNVPGQQSKIDINKYVLFAKNNGLLNDNVETILTKYGDRINNFLNYAKKEALDNQYLAKYMATGTSGSTAKDMAGLTALGAPLLARANIQKNNQNHVQNQNNFEQTDQIITKNGHKCNTPCKPGHNFFMGDYSFCDTDPYETFTGSYNWDYCRETN